MPPAARKDADVCTGHGCFPTAPTQAGSGNVFINGHGSHRLGDGYIVHCCGISCHSGTLAEGSSTVFVNSLKAGRLGDAVACGSTVATGSPNVFIGDSGGGSFTLMS